MSTQSSSLLPPPGSIPTTPPSTTTTPTPTPTPPPPSATSSQPPSPPPTSSQPPTTSSTPGTISATSTTTTLTTAASTTLAPPTSTAPPPTSTSTTVIPNTTASNRISTIVSVVSVTPTRSIAPASSSTSTSKSFFKNTGAVAGTFSVVGVVVLVAIVALVTNGIRRRRARKFDREIEEAAAVAATATAPPFLVDDEEDDHFGRGGYGNRGYVTGGYSDASSHGTFGQPALSTGHGQETYGMRELVHGPSPGEYYDSGYGGAAAAAGAGAAGVGVMRSRSTRDGGYASGLTEGASPYPAFAAPSMPQPRVNQDGYDLAGGPVGGYRGQGNPEYFADAAGVGAAGGAAAAAGLTRGQSQYNNQNNNNNNRYQPQQDYANLGRNKSLGSGESGYGSRQASPPTSGSISLDHNATPPAESYASHYQPGAYQSFAGSHGSQAAHQPEHEDIDDAYGGYIADDSPSQQYPNPFGPASPQSPHDEYEESSGDDEHHGRRVLKVANE